MAVRERQRIASSYSVGVIATTDQCSYFKTILAVASSSSLTKEHLVKKVILGLLTAITIGSGASLLYAQEPQPCSPIPAGCKVKDGCVCNNGVCSDSYTCGPINQT